MLDFDFLDRIRAKEIAATAALLGPPPARVLEIGAGSGVQAKYLADLGFEVKAIEVAGSEYEPLQVYPVAKYDGQRIPFPDNSFDVIYSSHVVMHIVDTVGFHREIQRVLKPQGRVVHVVPTSAWRFWTLVLHYPANLLGRCLRLFQGPSQPMKAMPTQANTPPVLVAPAEAAAATAPNPVSKLSRWLRLPRRIGEHGNVLTEHYLFSDAGWRQLFRQHGWVPLAGEPNRIFYTGHMALASRIPLSARRWLSYVLGSAGRLYVLRVAKSI
jgi:SAM-dependent methyltransferase